MAAVTICSDFGAQENKSLPLFPLFPHLFAIKRWDWMPQTGEQLYQRSSRTVAKVLGPTAEFPTWGSHKRTENPQAIWLWRPVDLITELPQDWGDRLLEGTNQNLRTPGSKRKEQWLHKRLSQNCLWVSRHLCQRCGLTMACHGDRGTEYNSHGSCVLA